MKSMNRRFQYSLRTLLVTVTLCALPFSWLGWRVNYYRRQHVVRHLVSDAAARVQVRPAINPSWMACMIPSDWIPQLERIDFRGKDVSSRDIAVLTQCQTLEDLEAVGLRGTRITDESLEYLSELKNVRILDLGNTGVTGHGLRHVARMTGLQCLWLDETLIDDHSLACLANLKQLRLLSLRRTRIDWSGLAHVGRLPHLEDLSLSSTSVTNESLSSLAGLPCLQTLRLNQTPISAQGVERLRGIASLQDLYVARTKVTDEAISHLASMMSLRTLDVRETRMSGSAFRLASLSGLRDLLLDGLSVSDSDVMECMPSKTIEVLSLAKCRLSGRGILPLRSYKRLKAVWLDGNKLSSNDACQLANSIQGSVCYSGHCYVNSRCPLEFRGELSGIKLPYSGSEVPDCARLGF
jgi:Leucine-rich repeat (LRR) protein